MAFGVTVSNITATTARLNFADIPAGNDSFDVQLSARPDFKWCVCPIFNVATGATYDLVGLNQSQTIYGRARPVDAGVSGAWAPTFGFRTPEAVAQVTAPAAIMIEPAIIMLPEPVLGWTPSNAVAGFPASNLGRDAPVGWKAVDGNPTLSIETAGTPWDTIVLLNTNAPEATTMTVRTGASAAAAAAAGPTLNGVAFRASANLPGRPGYHGLFQLPAVTANRFAHLTFGGANPPANTWFIEHGLIGLARVSHNHALEKKEVPLDLGSLERSRTGVPDRILGMKMRRVEFDLAVLTESQYETLYGDLGRRVGETEPVFVVPNSKRNFAFHDRLLYGNLSGGNITNPASPYYTRTFALDSMI